MKAQATQEPGNVFIEQTQDGYRVRLRKNIEQFEETFEYETQVMYRYDEVVLELSENDDIETYVVENFDYLFSIGSNRDYQAKVIQIKEYLDRGFLTEDDIDYYVSSGIIESKSEVI